MQSTTQLPVRFRRHTGGHHSQRTAVYTRARLPDGRPACQAILSDFSGTQCRHAGKVFSPDVGRYERPDTTVEPRPGFFQGSADRPVAWYWYCGQHDPIARLAKRWREDERVRADAARRRAHEHRQRQAAERRAEIRAAQVAVVSAVEKLMPEGDRTFDSLGFLADVLSDQAIAELADIRDALARLRELVGAEEAAA